jgi:hypothetical protein
MVRNTGAYAKAWWWYYGQTANDIANHARELNARIISLDAYEAGGSLWFAAVYISNTGNDATGWWWYYGQNPASIAQLVQQNKARLIDFRQYSVNGTTQYAVVMVDNTGTNSRGWWWYFNVPASQVSSNLQQNGAYLVSLQVANTSGPTFNVIMDKLPTPGGRGWWWYYGETAAELTNLYTQHAAWLRDVKTYDINGQRVFTALLLGGMPPAPPVHVLTQHNDNQRTGANLNETTLLPSLLRAGRFGFLFARNVEGQPYAQPLYVSGFNIPGKGVHNVVFVATTLNYVYAFDADDPNQAAPLWRSQQLGTPAHRANFVPFKLIDPAIGITSTPVIDLASSTLYVVAKSKTMEPVAAVQDLHPGDQWNPGDRVILESLGEVPGPRWLDGRTQDQTVGLAPTAVFPFTGTVWELGRVENNAFTLRSLGHLVGQRVDTTFRARYPYLLYLDGRTQDGTVGMASCTNDQPPPPTGACLPIFTGTRWDITPAGQGAFNLKNRGTIEGPRWLDGRTHNGTVGLAPTTGGGFTGTRWRLHRLSFHHHLYALDLATGRIKQSVEIEGNARGVTFDPTWQLNRAGLLLLNNVIYVSFAAHADSGPWHGWVFGYDATTLRPAGAYVTTPVSNWGGGIWQAGNGLVGDTAGPNVYFMTGNGNPNGPPPPEDLRNSFVKLRPSSGMLTHSGWYPPRQHRPELDWCDIDLGSAGPVQLPGTRRLAGAGKEGVLYLLDMETMAELQQFQATVIQYPPDSDKRPCPNRPDPGNFEVMRFYPHVHGSPVIWPLQPPDTFMLYLWAEQDRVRAFRYERGRFRSEPVAQSAVLAPQNSMPGGMLSLSANGNTPDTGILWATRPSDCADNTPDTGNNTVANMVYRICNGEENAVPGILHAFHAGSLEEVWNSDRPGNPPLGNLAKFAPPTIAAGKVYVATFGDPAQCSDQRCPSQLKVYGVRSSL